MYNNFTMTKEAKVQIDGVSMGSPLDPVLENVFMSYDE